MIRWEHLDTATAPGGGELKLMRRGAEYSIMAGAIELMNSRLSGSEQALATLACERIGGRKKPQMLIGGLGMGFTLRAALGELPADGGVTVAELVPAVVAWARGPLAHIFDGSLEDPRVTEAQRAAATELIDTTRAAIAGYADPAAVEAAGYISIGDAPTGYEHYINVGYIADGIDLDPSRIESVVYTVAPDGTRTLASGMYILGFGTTMADVPDVAGELTTWHDHQNLCWEGARVVGTTDATGSCQRGTFRPTPPMLHVWVTENPCGPFAGIEGAHGSGCAHSHTG